MEGRGYKKQRRRVKESPHRPMRSRSPLPLRPAALDGRDAESADCALSLRPSTTGR